MRMNFERVSGVALITGSLLAVFTMALHPAGGNFERLIKMAALTKSTHSVGIASVIVMLFGFLGLSKHLKEHIVFSSAGFITICFALFAVLISATLNGLAVPLFVSHYKDASAVTIESLKPVLAYNISLNNAFDFVFIGSGSFAFILFSLAIIKVRKFPIWTGYYGIVCGLTGLVLLFSGVILVDLTGFTIFIFGFVSWTIVCGIYLYKSGTDSSGK